MFQSRKVVVEPYKVILRTPSKIFESINMKEDISIRKTNTVHEFVVLLKFGF